MTKKELVCALYKELHKLLNIEEKLNLAIGEENMDPTITDLLKRMDTATNDVAALLQAFIEKAAQAGSVTSAEVAAALGPQVVRLEGIGKDPSNPV